MKKPSPEEIEKLILGEFGDKDIVTKISSDDGGSILEIYVQGKEISEEIRKLIPLNYEGWRTVVFYNPDQKRI